MDKTDYVDKLSTILSDRSKFVIVNDDIYKATLSLEEKS